MAQTQYGEENISSTAFDPLAGLDWSMHLIDPKKKDAKWAYQVVKFLYSNMNYYYSYRGYNTWNSFNLIREYSEGRQNPDFYKEMFDPQNKSERTGANPVVTTQFVGLNWKIISLIPKYRRIIEGRLNKIKAEVECECIDTLAKNTKQEEALRLKGQKYFQEYLDDFSRRMNLNAPIKGSLAGEGGVATRDTSASFGDIEFDLSNDEELQIYMDSIGFKLKEEIASEITLNQVLQLNEIQRILKLTNRDAIDFAFRAVRVYRDNNTMFPKIEKLDINRIMLPPSGRNDKKDIGGWGYYEMCSLNRIVELLGNEMTPATLRNLYKFATTSPTGVPIAGFTDINTQRLTYFDFERVKLPMVYIEFLSQNCQTYKYTKDRFGSEKAEEVEFGCSLKKGEKGRIQQHWAQVAYTGYYIPNYTEFLGFKMLENLQREDGNPQYCKFSAIFWEDEPKSITEQLIPHADNIQLAELKLQQALLKALPSGWSFNVDAISNIILGNSSITPQTIMKLYLQTGSAIHRSVDENGIPILANANAPHQRLEGGLLLRECEGYWNTIAHNIDMMEKIIGYNPQLAGSAPDPRQAVGGLEMAAAAADNATYFLIEGTKYMLQDISTVVFTHIQDIIKEKGKAYKALSDMVGTLNLDVIESLDKLPLHKVGINIKEKMSDERRQLMYALLMQEYGRGGVDFSDVIAFEMSENEKQAIALINLRAKKKQQKMIQASQAQAEQNNQINASLQQLKLLIAQSQNDTTLKKAQIAAQSELEKEIIRQRGNDNRSVASHLSKLEQNYQTANLKARNDELERAAQSQEGMLQ